MSDNIDKLEHAAIILFLLLQIKLENSESYN